MSSGYCIPCKSSVRAGHVATAKHQRNVRPAEYHKGSGDWLDARPPRPMTRDWDAEQAEHERQRSRERELFTAALIRYGPLPEPPAIQYSGGMALITLKEAADRLGVQPVTLRMAIRRGKMHGHKYGRDWLVEESEVAWYEMRSRGRVGWPKGRPRKTA